MAPPLSQADLDAIGRIVDKKIDARLEPIERRVGTHSAVHRDLLPEVARKIEGSRHDLEDRSMGFERMMMTVVGRIEEKVDAAVTSIPPAALAAKGAELAAVAGAQASVRSENKTDAIQVAANRADTHSLSAKVASNRSLIVQIVIAVALGLWEAYRAVMRVP